MSLVTIVVSIVVSATVGFFLGRREAETAFKKGTRRWVDGALHEWIPPDRPDKEGIWYKR